MTEEAAGEDTDGESGAWALAEQGPCARCRRPCRRYGLRGRPLCDECLAARNRRQADGDASGDA